MSTYVGRGTDEKRKELRVGPSFRCLLLVHCSVSFSYPLHYVYIYSYFSFPVSRISDNVVLARVSVVAYPAAVRYQSHRRASSEVGRTWIDSYSSPMWNLTDTSQSRYYFPACPICRVYDTAHSFAKYIPLACLRRINRLLCYCIAAHLSLSVNHLRNRSW